MPICLDDRFIGRPTSVKKIGKTFDTHMYVTAVRNEQQDIGKLHSLCVETAKRSVSTDPETFAYNKEVQVALQRINVATADLEFNAEHLPWLVAYSRSCDLED